MKEILTPVTLLQRGSTPTYIQSLLGLCSQPIWIRHLGSMPTMQTRASVIVSRSSLIPKLIRGTSSFAVQSHHNVGAAVHVWWHSPHFLLPDVAKGALGRFTLWAHERSIQRKPKSDNTGVRLENIPIGEAVPCV